MPASEDHGDIFDDLLGLEDSFYSEGHELGVADGARAGHIEGKVFGMETGFEKFIEMGRQHGRALVWSRRTASGSTLVSGPNIAEPASPVPFLLGLTSNARLEKNIRSLITLTDPSTLSCANAEEAVADFDDRLKKAFVKTKMIKKSLGEEESLGRQSGQDQKSSPADAGGNIEDISALHARH